MKDLRKRDLVPSSRAAVLEGVEAFLFDMDGTLIDSAYDWRAIRRELGVGASSIIEHLNGLAGPEREEKWEALREIERKATRKSRPKDGARDLLAFLRARGIRTALVTNNSEENARYLVERFELDLDVVLTRDSGLWKPSGAPLKEALRQLEVAPSSALAVGDSLYDVLSAREAECRGLCLLFADREELAREADLCFADIRSFLDYLRAML